MIKKSEFKSNKNYLNELNTLQDLRHKNIIKIYDTFSDKEHLYLIEELASRDLFKEIVDGQISEDKARGLVNSILDALEFMHKRSPKIIHADLKPENILVSKGVLKIADFGLAQMLKHGENYTQNETVLGSIPYMSPVQDIRSLWKCPASFANILINRKRLKDAADRKAISGRSESSYTLCWQNICHSHSKIKPKLSGGYEKANLFEAQSSKKFPWKRRK